MDPIGPWSAYTSYNRLAGVQAGAGAEIHHQLAAQSGTPTTTTQLLPTTFLTTTPVGYENVFSPLFHAAGAKAPVHYVAQHRQPHAQTVPVASSKPATEAEYQGQAYFTQTGPAWQQNSPFGVLPHESITPSTTASKTANYENFTAHFVTAQSLNHLNTQLVTSNTKNPTPHPQTPSAKPASQQFFQVPTNAESSSPKTFVSNSTSNLQQTCIVTSASNSKDYRTSNANRNAFQPSEKQTAPQIQTKAQTKIYPDLNNQQADRQRSGDEAQSSPVSFSVEVPSVLNFRNTNKPGQQFQSSSYRHYQSGNNTDTDFQHAKSPAEYSNGNGPRSSPLQSHSSPLGHLPTSPYPMYNSSSSPQQASIQVTSPPALDVAASRTNSQNVAYPSVITRALNNEKKFPEHFERIQQQQPNCWDEQQRQAQHRKFAPPEFSPVNSMNECQQRNAPSQNRQAFFNASSPHQVPLQDLGSCRGDPISLVKNMQQQQGCQIQQISVGKAENKPSKRRKSGEKLQQLHSEVQQGSAIPDYFTGRIPPPAHTSASNQQQNGVFYEFDRWNLPPPPTKVFVTQPVHQQPQGLMVTHPHSHHPPPPLSYFPPFPLTSHPEYQQNVEVNQVYNEQTAQQSASDPEQPKVVVPNIEEELDFLSGGTSTKKPAVTPNMRLPTTTASSSDRPSGTAGFMNSYLKFLQGDRETSPPPKNNRKQAWSKTKSPVVQTVPQTNGIAAPLPPLTPIIPTPRLSQGDPQDDPRYFPLPKERKKDRFNSSDDGFSSDDDLFSKQVGFTKNNFSRSKTFKRSKGSKAPPLMRNVSVNRKPTPKKAPRPRKDTTDNKALPSITPDLPRRESSKRAAKDKSNLRNFIVDDEMDYLDSDSDPAWSPKGNDDDEVMPVMKKGRRIKYGGRSRQSRNLISAAAQCAGINDLDGYISDGISRKAKVGSTPILALENNIGDATPTVDSMEDSFMQGQFVVQKTDLIQEWPPLWRLDGKAHLQRYEPFEQDGKTLYKNVQTYITWVPENAKQYTPAPVVYLVQGPAETIVEFLRKNADVSCDLTIIGKSMEASQVYQDNFEVYIQTLISQALDSNFLTEIFQEQDEYFLSNVKTIDDITDNQKHKVTCVLQWPKPVLIAVNTWPCFNILNEFNSSNIHTRPCSACLRPGVSVRVLMYGQPYNLTTLEGLQLDSYVDKDFLMCRTCANQVELFNKITHQKYLMFIQCAKKVAEKRSLDSSKDTTCILNELLADEIWLNKLFNDVRCLWAEVDCLEYRCKVSNQCSDSNNDKAVA